MLRKTRTVALIAGALATHGAAHADDPAAVPRGIALDRTAARSSGGIEISWSSDDAPGEGSSAARLDLFAQVIASGGLGGYGVVPLLWGDAGDGDGVSFAPGNPELGVVYAASGPALTWLLRAGSTLPLASESDAIARATPNRLTDVVHVRGKDATARLSVSPVVRASGFTARVDAGIDVTYVHIGDGNRSTALRLAAGAGHRIGAVDAWIEAVNLLDDETRYGDGFSNKAGWQHAFSAAVRLAEFPVKPVVGATVAIIDYGPDQRDPVYVIALGSELVPPAGWIRRPAPGRR